MDIRQQDKDSSNTYRQQSEIDGKLRSDVSDVCRKSILCVATTGAKDICDSEGHDRKLRQSQNLLHVAHGNDSYFESNYLESEVQGFFVSDQAIIADTPNIAGMDSERKAKPGTLPSHESPLTQLERVAEKLHAILMDDFFKFRRCF